MVTVAVFEADTVSVDEALPAPTPAEIPPTIPAMAAEIVGTCPAAVPPY